MSIITIDHNNAKHKAVVLDYSTGEVHIYSYEDSLDDLDEFMVDKGHRLSECYIMSVHDLNIIIHD